MNFKVVIDKPPIIANGQQSRAVQSLNHKSLASARDMAQQLLERESEPKPKALIYQIIERVVETI